MGLTIPSNGRVFWTGANAAIPANWTRDTDFDDHYIQGVSSDQRTSLGATSHSHTQSHTHNGVAHTHTYSAGSSSGLSQDMKPTTGGASYDSSKVGHSHNNATSSSQTITYQNNTTSSDNADGSHPALKLIVIKPDSGNENIPDDCVCWTDTETPPTGFSKCDGTGGTVNLNTYFIKGSDTGDDAGGYTGSAQHSHTMAAHLHVANNHFHSGTLCGTATSVESLDDDPAEDSYLRSQHHEPFMNSRATTVNTTAANSANTAYEPYHTELLGIQNTSGGASTPVGVIIPYVGTIASIPTGWVLCNGSSGTPDLTASQIKSVTSGVLDTGGSNLHQHYSFSHTHTESAHNHVINGSVVQVVVNYDCEDDATGVEVNYDGVLGARAAMRAPTPPHQHTTWTVNNSTATIQNTSIIFDSADGRYKYRTVVFIKKIAYTSVHILGNTSILGNTHLAA